MDEHEVVDMVPIENSFVGSEDFEDEPGELTATPLKRYVVMVGDRKDRSACKWLCTFGCRNEPYTGTYSRIRAHLIGLLPGQKSQGVILCSKVNVQEREKMKKEEDEAKRVFGSSTRRATIPNYAIVSSAYKMTTGMMTEKEGDFSDTCSISSRNEVDGAIARFFYGNGIPFNVAKSPLWIDMVRAINQAPKRYRPPYMEKLKTTLLDKERTNVDQALMFIKQQWPTYGVSIVLDGWTNTKSRPLINVMAVSGGKAMCISVLDCTRDEKSGEFIAEILLKAIETVGPYYIVQVLTDNAPVCKTAGIIIENRYPHIFWSACIAHTLSLLLKDIINSTHPTLAFVGNCYGKAKGIVKYIKNHNLALSILRTFSPLNVVQVRKTRFGNHFVVLDRVFRVKNTLMDLMMSEEWETLQKGGSTSNMTLEEVRKIVLDDDFWKSLKNILTFMKPIWRVICFCDSGKGEIGEVYQRMDDMLGCIKEALSDNAEMYQVVQDLVMIRWEKMNLPLHTLAYVLTPYFYSESWLTNLAPGGEKRKKPHADPDVYKTYLDAVDRLVRDSEEASLIRQQLSDFVSSRGVFSRSQAIKDRETMPAISWWDLYGVTAPELYSLAVKVLSQSVTTSCAERTWSTCEYICNVKKNRMNVDRAESLAYVHYNYRLLTRYREDYEETYQNWDCYVNDENLEIDIEAIEDKEYALLYAGEVDVSRPLPDSIATSSLPPQKRKEYTSSGKRQRKG